MTWAKEEDVGQMRMDQMGFGFDREGNTSICLLFKLG